MKKQRIFTTVPPSSLLLMLYSFNVSNNNQAFVGITALLAVFPPCLGATEISKEHQPKHDLLSGSVCRVRDSLDFLSVSIV